MRKPLLVMAVVLLNGCALLAHTLPDWWQTPPNDSQQWLYGLGEGTTLDIARQQALANIAGKLQTQLSAQLSVRTQETNAAADQYADRQLRTSVTDVNLSHYQIRQTDTDPQQHRTRVLLRLDRAALAATWQRQAQNLLAQLDTAQQRKPGETNFRWWLRARQAQETAIHADALAVLRSLLTEQNIAADQQQRLQQTIAAIPMTINVTGNNTQIKQQLTNVLNAMGLQPGHCERCQLSVWYETRISDSKLFDEQVATLTFHGKLLDRKGVVAETRWTVQGSSISDRNIAHKAASTIAAQKIKNEGLFTAFGLSSVKPVQD